MLTQDLRDKIQQYIKSAISLTDLEEWIVPRLPVFIASAHSADADVVSAVELGLAEINAGLRTEKQLQEYLAQVLREQHVTRLFFNATIQNDSGATNETLQQSVVSQPRTPVIIADW
ncbi:MAG TPA: hypothetical protein VJL59_14050 [Anaerolineales bacterium]|nr:hypothetical protein [Anaerolineales bacterium]